MSNLERVGRSDLVRLMVVVAFFLGLLMVSYRAAGLFAIGVAIPAGIALVLTVIANWIESAPHSADCPPDEPDLPRPSVRQQVQRDRVAAIG